MSVTVHEEFVQPVTKVRRRRSRLALRQPVPAYAPAAFFLLYATGLMGMLATATALLGHEATSAVVLSMPACVAALVTAGTVGLRVFRLQERQHLGIVLRTAGVWMAVGAVWPLLQIIPAIAYGDVTNVPQFLSSLGDMTFDAIAGAVSGGIGGVCCALAATALCVERVR